MRKHRRTAREALWYTDDAKTALGPIQAQMVQVGQQREDANRRAEVLEEARTRTMVLAMVEFGRREEEYLHRL